MMKLSEVYRFSKRHYQIDAKLAFICRMARFGLLSVPVMIGEFNARKYRKGEHQVDVMGNKMLLTSQDKGIGTDLLLCRKREPLICDKFREVLSKGMVVYDIGANIGYYALQEAQLVGDEGHVYAIEPVPENVERLGKNVALNQYKNIDIYNLAMGDLQANGEIKVSAMSNMASMMDKGYRCYERIIPVKVDTIDHFMQGKRPPDVIRMDTEGYEVNIIQGMKELLNTNRPLILFIEVHFDALKEKVISLLKTLKDVGFKVKWAAHETHPIAQDSWIRPLVNLCEKGMGASGYINVSIDDLMTQRRFLSGQVENLEVIFERK